MDASAIVSAVSAELREGWQPVRKLAGGWNEGAYLVSRPGGSMAVLKWRASEPERMLGAHALVARARARGWPAPAWLAWGQAPTGEAWVLQEFVDGRTPVRLDDTVAAQMIGILEVQASLCEGASGGWGEWAWGVVFEDWAGMRDRAGSAMPGGRRIVATVDAIAAECQSGPLSNQDLVHGNFNLANVLVTAGRLWVVDVEGLAAGPRAYDLAEALLVAAKAGNVTEHAAARLWAYAGGLDHREFAICAGSVSLTMADAVGRHGKAEPADAAGRIVRALEQALELARA